MRTSRAIGTSLERARSTPCAPVPWRTMAAAWHRGHTPGTRSSRPQWWHTSRAGPSWWTRATSQSGQRAIQPHSRQSAMSEKPRRVARTMALSPRSIASWRAEASGRETGPAPCRRMSTISAVGSGEPSARAGRVRRGSALQVSGRGVALP